MNKRTMIALAVVFVFGFGFAAAHSYAARMMGRSGYRAYEVRSLIGAQVENPVGKVVGSIKDFEIDSNGHIVFAILNYDFPYEYVPVPPQTVAVPFNEIAVRPNGKVALLKFSGWKLELAPKFAKSDINNRKWTDKDYRYFGESPYWTEGGHMKGKASYRWGGEAQNF